MHDAIDLPQTNKPQTLTIQRSDFVDLLAQVRLLIIINDGFDCADVATNWSGGGHPVDAFNVDWYYYNPPTWHIFGKWSGIMCFGGGYDKSVRCYTLCRSGGRSLCVALRVGLGLVLIVLVVDGLESPLDEVWRMFAIALPFWFGNTISTCTCVCTVAAFTLELC